MKEEENILRILEETLESINSKNYLKIRKLSNQTINTASLTQDPDNLMVAVIVYSLYKIFEREDYQNYSGWDKFFKIIINSLEHSIDDLKSKDFIHFRKDFGQIREAIKKLSGKLKKYVEEVFTSAKINKASRLYEHGISMENTAKLLDISLYDLAEYVGKTGISDVSEKITINESSRIKIAMDFFK